MIDSIGLRILSVIATFIFCICRTVHGGILMVDGCDPNADDRSAAAGKGVFRTINAAAQIAGPGDIVRVRSGIYREWVRPARGGGNGQRIVYEAYPNEKVEVRGSDLWTNRWHRATGYGKGVYESDIDESVFAQGFNPYLTCMNTGPAPDRRPARPVQTKELEHPWPLTLGQLFLGERELTEVRSERELKSRVCTWLVSFDGRRILVNIGEYADEQSLSAIEWTVRPRVFSPLRRGLADITVRGFVFRRAAARGPFPQAGMVSCRSGRNWVFDRLRIMESKTIGLDVGSEAFYLNDLDCETIDGDRRHFHSSGHVVRKCLIARNGLCGIAGWKVSGCRVFDNTVEFNNTGGWASGEDGAEWEEWAGMKFHLADVIVERNVVRWNEGHGIWLDTGYAGARISGNLIHDNLMSGVMMEYGFGVAEITGNVIANSRSVGESYSGHGIYAHDASDLSVNGNLLINNSGFGVFMRTVTNRKVGGRLVETSGERIERNVFASNARGAIALPDTSIRSKDNSCDRNVFLGNPCMYLCRFVEPFQWRPSDRHLPDKGFNFRAFSVDEWRVRTGMDAESSILTGISVRLQPFRHVVRFSVDNCGDAAIFNRLASAAGGLCAELNEGVRDIPVVIGAPVAQ